MKASILTIGDEICIGQIVNTNAAWIAEKCTLIGIDVSIHSSIGDEKNIMLNEIDRLINNSDIVLVTGGLGPTHDDLTKPALCEYFEDHLVLHEDSLRNIEQLFIRRGNKISERNKEQAMVPSKCKPIINTVGTAPGMIFEKVNNLLISMPGVPSEMKKMMESDVLPMLEKLMLDRNEPIIYYKSLMTAGIFESSLADLIGDPLKFLEGGTLAFLPSYRGVRLRIGVKSSNITKAKEKLEKIENIITERAGQYIISTNNEPLNQVVGNLLKESGKTIAVAESCTAGMLGESLTEFSGSSDYFLGGVIVYSNEAKIKLLDVSPKTIIDFGAVSEQTALELASNVKSKFTSDYGVSITGIAGPTGGSGEKPVGIVWIGISDSKGTTAKSYYFNGVRSVIRERAVGMALTMIYEKLKGK